MFEIPNNWFDYVQPTRDSTSDPIEQKQQHKKTASYPGETDSIREQMAKHDINKILSSFVFFLLVWTFWNFVEPFHRTLTPLNHHSSSAHEKTGVFFHFPKITQFDFMGQFKGRTAALACDAVDFWLLSVLPQNRYNAKCSWGAPSRTAWLSPHKHFPKTYTSSRSINYIWWTFAPLFFFNCVCRYACARAHRWTSAPGSRLSAPRVVTERFDVHLFVNMFCHLDPLILAGKALGSLTLSESVSCDAFGAMRRGEGGAGVGATACDKRSSRVCSKNEHAAK